MPLQKPFVGLSDLVGAFTLGNLSFELGSVIAPALDISDFIEPPRIIEASVPLTTVTQSVQITTATVPEGELWRLHWMGCGCTFESPSNFRLMPVAFLPSQQTRIGLTTINPQSFNLSVAHYGIQFDKPFLAVAGMDIGWFTTILTPVASPILKHALAYQRILV